VGAVAAEHQAPGERLHVTGHAGVHPDGAFGGRPDRAVYRVDLGLTVEADQRVLPDPAQQELFQAGLVEHVRLREAVHADLVLAAEFGHHPVPGVEQPQPAAGPGPGQERVADPDPAERPGHLVVQMHRARQRMRAGVAFQQGHGDAQVGQQEGHGAADRAGADHNDAVLGAGARPGAGVLIVHGGPPLLGGSRRGPAKALTGW
jgi:hypothetical protein